MSSTLDNKRTPIGNHPGSERDMYPKPLSDDPTYQSSEKLKDKIVLITGGESGIGKAISILFAKEKAKLAIGYLNEEELEDVRDTDELIKHYGGSAIFVKGDISDPEMCKHIVERTVREYGRIDILINNAAMQMQYLHLEEIPLENILKTFQVNIIAMFLITQAALPHMVPGSCIINTTSVTAYEGHPGLLDYSSTKGAVVSFTRSLARNLAQREIRVNGVAPGPIWTPMIPTTSDEEQASRHGRQTPMQRAGQPVEVAHSYLFLASASSSYMTGQILHPNGGSIING